ncbi:MAG: hypothetical protein GF381_03510 [Candidatus Pacebacteria bacterium]|nr:hypothetical protein [Candidatus Paceibacterota bacterium]
MRQKQPSPLTTLLISGLIGFYRLFQPSSVLAQTQSWSNIEPSCVARGDVATIQGVMCLLANVLSVSLTFIGLIGFIMMVVGSIQWMLAGGNSQEVEKAGKTMLYAFIGLVLALSSFIIINIIAQFTGVNIIKEFFIPDSDYQWDQQLP